MAQQKGSAIEDVYVRMGERIAALRRKRGLTQEELGALAGVTANYLARTERGYHRTNLAKIEAVAEALGVSLSSLFVHTPEWCSSVVLPSLLTGLRGLGEDDQRLLVQLVRRLRRASRQVGAAARRRRP